MTNIVEASMATKQVQVTSKSQSKSPKGDFEALFNLETEALNTGSTEEVKTGNGVVFDIEKEAKVLVQEGVIVDEEIDENDVAIIDVSYLIQGNPTLQIKNSVPSHKPSVDNESADILLTSARNLKYQETPAIPLIKESQDSPELVKEEANSGFKAETSAPIQVQSGLPQELTETETHAIPETLTETKNIDMLPQKQSKRDAIIPDKNRHELEQQKIEGTTSESKAAPKTDESILKGNLLSPFGEGKENENSSDTKKQSQSDRIENFPSVMKASEFQKPQIPTSPEVTRVESENMDLATKEILHQMETLTDGNKTMVNVKLNPVELGEMEISLSMEEGKLTGKIVVGNKEIQQIFTDKLHELNQTLKENRIDVASFEVKLSPDQNQNQDQARQQGRRAMEYPNRINSQRNGSTQPEERIRPASTSNRGIDILA